MIKNYIQTGKILPMSLSNEQKGKLYAMSVAIIANDNKWAKVHLSDKSIRIPRQGEKQSGYDEIHWFELCTTHLAFHIMNNPFEYLKYCSKYAMDSEDMEHPIDYLYKEFELIKELYI